MTDREEAEEGAASSEAGDEPLMFDVLVRAEGADAGALPSLGTIDQLRPSSEAIERCFRWFSARGATCHQTDFGLSCQAPVDTFQDIFGEAALERDPTGHWQVTSTIAVPTDLDDLIAQVTIVRPPELF